MFARPPLVPWPTWVAMKPLEQFTKKMPPKSARENRPRSTHLLPASEVMNTSSSEGCRWERSTGSHASRLFKMNGVRRSALPEAWLSTIPASSLASTGGVTSCQRRPPSWLVNSSVELFSVASLVAMAQPSDWVTRST